VVIAGLVPAVRSDYTETFQWSDLLAGNWLPHIHYVGSGDPEDFRVPRDGAPSAPPEASGAGNHNLQELSRLKIS